jgi:hypothetical protein
MHLDDLLAVYAQQDILLGPLQLLYETPTGPAYTLTTTGLEAISLWRQLRAAAEATGYWPILLGQHNWPITQEHPIPDVTALLQQAESLQGATYFRAREEELEDVNEDEPIEDEWLEMIGGEIQPNTTFVTPFDLLENVPYATLTLALIPTRKSWEIPAYLGFGDWNECPHPATQVAILRYWHTQYGAEPVAITGDVMELQVEHPPQDEAEALVLAREHYLFCPDIVDQGVQSITNLAQTVVKAPVWYFWWD